MIGSRVWSVAFKEGWGQLTVVSSPSSIDPSITIIRKATFAI